MDMLISFIVTITSQGVCISNYHIAYLKFIQVLFVNYTSTKLGRKITTAGEKPCNLKKFPDKFCFSDFLSEGHIFNINSSWGHYWIKWENAFNTLEQYLAPRNF